jgi:hypothetical protein
MSDMLKNFPRLFLGNDSASSERIAIAIEPRSALAIEIC